MYRNHSIAVIVPAYNEVTHIGIVLATIPEFVDCIYAVDDASTDGTWKIIRDLAEATKEMQDGDPVQIIENEPIPKSIADGGMPSQTIIPIRHSVNQGAGGALRTGYVRSLQDGYDIIVTMDADGQMDPTNLPELLDAIIDTGAGYAKGNRLSIHEWGRMPRFRLVGNWVLTVLTKIASGYWSVTDPQNGYTAISREALASVDIEQLPNDHDYPNDLLVRLNVADVRVADVPMPAVYEDEESSINYRTFIPTTSITLLRGFLWRLRRQYLQPTIHPIAACYGCGLVLFILGLSYGLVFGSMLRGGIVAMIAITLVAMAMRADARLNQQLEVNHG